MPVKPNENTAISTADHSYGINPLQALLETATDVFCVLDPEGNILEVSRSAHSVLGYPDRSFLNRNFAEFACPTHAEAARAFIQSLAAAREVRQWRGRFTHRNGELIHMLWSGILDPEQKAIYCAGKEICAAPSPTGFVRNPERLLKQTLQIVRMGSWDYVVDTNQLYWSSELFDIYGVNPGHDIDLEHLFFTLVHPEDLAMVRQYLEDINHLESSFVHRIVRPDKKTIYVSQNISVLKNQEGRIVKLAGLTQDVTDSHEYKSRLEQSERRFRALVQTGSDIIGVIDPQGNYQYVSDNTRSILGFDPQSLIGKNAFDFIHPDDAPYVYEQLATIRVENQVDIKPFRFRNAAGEWRWIETKLSNRLNDTSIRGLVANSRDITDRKEFGDKIARLSKIAEETSNAVVTTDASGHITWVNKAFEEITGYVFQEVKGKKPGALLQGPLSNPDTIAYMRQQLQKGEPFDVELINYTKKGTPYWMQINCQPQLDNNGTLLGHFAIQTDITERKRLQHQLQEEVRQRQKRITSAIVTAQENERTELSHELHDNVNQILNTVFLYLEMASDGNGSLEMVAKAKEMVQFSIEEIRQISKRLAVPHLTKRNLKHAILELVHTIAVTGKLKIQFTDDGLEGRYVPTDAQLVLYRITQEHLTNIIKHAAAANVTIAISVKANTLRLQIADDGRGFDLRQKRKGIGLQNMRNRVETANGKITIKSQPGQGCTLMVSLPLNSNPKTGN
jgi:PAS domain S-box-containing protein